MEKIQNLVKLIVTAENAEEQQRLIRKDYYKQLLSLLSELPQQEKEKFVKENSKLVFNLSRFMAEQKGVHAIAETKEFFDNLPDSLDKFVDTIRNETKKGLDKIVDTLSSLGAKIF